MGALEDLSNGTGSFNYLTEIIVILAIAIVVVIIVLVYTLQRKKKPRESPAEPYVPPETCQVFQQTVIDNWPETTQQQYSEKIPPAPEPSPINNGPAYPGSIVIIGNYTLFHDRIQISPRKSIFYDEITEIRYESNFNSRVIITIGHAWELSLTAEDQTLKLYNSLMDIMNSDMMLQQMNRKRRMLR